MSAATPPFPTSQCHTCAQHRDVKSARSWFLLCQAPAMPKYPAQPVHQCPGYQPTPKS